MSIRQKVEFLSEYRLESRCVRLELLDEYRDEKPRPPRHQRQRQTTSATLASPTAGSTKVSFRSSGMSPECLSAEELTNPRLERENGLARPSA